MRLHTLLDRVLHQEDINFFITNRIPRRLATRAMGWFSEIEQPLVRELSIGIWKHFAGDPRLDEARKSHFTSLHDCFIRELKDGARPIARAPGTLVSPCDAIVGTCGRIDDSTLIQAKDSSYSLDELIPDARLAEPYRDGTFVTLRLTASMYHRFHAPDDSDVREVLYIAGDTWNVNPPTLKRVPRLFCRNERAIVPINLSQSGESITLVAVGAILVAGIRLGFVDLTRDTNQRGPRRFDCDARFARGDEMGYFRHGSTILVLATRGLAMRPGIRTGDRIRMGEPLLCHQNGTSPNI